VGQGLGVRHQGPGRVGDEDLMRRALGHPLEPRCGVGGVADRRVLDAALGADLPGHHVAAVDPDSHVEAVSEARLAHPGVESREPLAEHLSGRRDGAIGVVWLLDRRPEDGHDPVPHIGDQGPAVVHDRVAHLREVVVEDVDHLVRRQALGEGGEAAQVAEHHRPLAPHPAQPQILVGALEHFVDDGLGNEPGEGVAHLLALVGGDQRDHDEGADRRDQERQKGVSDAEYPAAVERELHRDDEGDRQGQRGPEGEQRPQAHRRYRAHQTEERDQGEVEPAGNRLQREAVLDGPDRVRLDFDAGHFFGAAGRRRVVILQRGRGGADDDDLAAEGARRGFAQEHV